MDLRIKRDSEQLEQGDQPDQPRLVFPRSALDQARGKAKLPNPLPPVGDLAAQIDAELNRAQGALTQLGEDVEAIYKFPPRDGDEPPSTAA